MTDDRNPNHVYVPISDPLMRDCLRGRMWEEKERGTLPEFIPLPDLEHPHTRLYHDEASSPPTSYWERDDWGDIMRDWPNAGGRAGFGTYRYKGQALVEFCIQTGVPLIDTAETYGYGRVEESVGYAIHSFGTTGSTWIATKVARNHMSKPATINAALRSRERLRIPIIDLYQVHWPVMDRLPDTFDALELLLKDKVIKRVGVCNFCAGQLAVAMRLASLRGFKIHSLQVRVNRSDPSALAYLIPKAHALGIRTIAYSPLGQGDLKEDAEAALKWLMRTQVDLAIPATNKLDHLRANLAIGKGEWK